jgi:cytochrome c heme-lyase
MFFDAMRRRGKTNGESDTATDMRTVVPIHNAVNERAWAEIKAWEAPYCASTGCGGPRLHSFAGNSSKMTPRARLNTLLGYTAPFDRHDWVVDRCGTTVEYVIDFYAGRSTSSTGPVGPDGKVSFYLDVRPKLNSWEGVRMRVLRGLGMA